MKKLLLPATLFVFLGLSACQQDSAELVAYQKNTGIAMEKQRPLYRIMSAGSKSQALTDAEWKELEALSKDSDPKVRQECIIAIGGVTKKGEQAAKAAALLRTLQNDPDKSVKEGATAFLELFEKGGSS